MLGASRSRRRAASPMTADSAKTVPVAPASWAWRIARVDRHVRGGDRAGIRHRVLGMALARPDAGAPLPPDVAGALVRRRSSRVPLFGRPDAPLPPAPEAPATLQGDTRLLGVFAGADGTGHALFRLARPRPRPRALRRGDREGRDAARSASRRRSHPGPRRNARASRLRTNVASTARAATTHNRAPLGASSAACARARPATRDPSTGSTRSSSPASRRGRTAGPRCSRRFRVDSPFARVPERRRCSA